MPTDFDNTTSTDSPTENITSPSITILNETGSISVERDADEETIGKEGDQTTTSDAESESVSSAFLARNGAWSTLVVATVALFVSAVY